MRSVRRGSRRRQGVMAPYPLAHLVSAPARVYFFGSPSARASALRFEFQEQECVCLFTPRSSRRSEVGLPRIGTQFSESRKEMRRRDPSLVRQAHQERTSVQRVVPVLRRKGRCLPRRSKSDGRRQGGVRGDDHRKQAPNMECLEVIPRLSRPRGVGSCE